MSADPARSVWDGPLAVLVDTGTRGSGGDRGRGPPRRRPGARSSASARSAARAIQKAVPAPRGRARPHGGPLLLAQGNADPRPGVEPIGPRGQSRRRDRRRARLPAIPSSTRRSRCCARAPAARRRPSHQTPELLARGRTSGTRRAAMRMGAPVRGSRPSRARRRPTAEGCQSPRVVTFSPLVSVFPTLLERRRRGRRLASALVSPASRATRTISSALFISPAPAL